MADDEIKAEIIHQLFLSRMKSDSLEKAMDLRVTMEEVLVSIREWRRRKPHVVKKLSLKNAANFFKDFVRSPHRNAKFPQAVLQEGYTARQAIGKGGCFEFVEIPPGYEGKAFLDFTEEGATEQRVETISMPIPARRMGRKDESWVTQVIARLNLVATHFALHSGLRGASIQLDHLQTGAKLGHAEVDGLFLLTLSHEGGPLVEGERLLVALEVKTRDMIEEEQITRGAQTALLMARKQAGIDIHRVVPLALKVIGESRLLLVEFQPISDDTDLTFPWRVESKVIYKLEPRVPGVAL